MRESGRGGGGGREDEIGVTWSRGEESRKKMGEIIVTSTASKLGTSILSLQRSALTLCASERVFQCENVFPLSLDIMSLRREAGEVSVFSLCRHSQAILVPIWWGLTAFYRQSHRCSRGRQGGRDGQFWIWSFAFGTWIVKGGLFLSGCLDRSRAAPFTTAKVDFRTGSVKLTDDVWLTARLCFSKSLFSALHLWKGSKSIQSQRLRFIIPHIHLPCQNLPPTLPVTQLRSSACSRYRGPASF